MENKPIDYTKLSPELIEKLKMWEEKKRGADPANKQTQLLADIADMMQELINVTDKSTTTENLTANVNALGALLADAREQLTKLNTNAETITDYSVPVVKAVKKLEEALAKSIEKINITPTFNPTIKPEVKVSVPKIDAPVVNVDPPSVSVDLKGVEKIIKNDIPKAFKEAIKLIPPTEIPEATDRWDEVLEWLESIDTASRMKSVFPTQMSVVIPDGTAIDGGTTPTVTSVSDTTSSTTLLAANSGRKQAIIENDSSATLYMLFGTGTASATNKTATIRANERVVTSYKGAIVGVWTSDTAGAARITEVE